MERLSNGFIGKRFAAFPTAGGNHRIPQSELDRLLFGTREKTAHERANLMRRLSGRNQLVGRIDSVQVSGLIAEVIIKTVVIIRVRVGDCVLRLSRPKSGSRNSHSVRKTRSESCAAGHPAACEGNSVRAFVRSCEL